jgi:hypothetical protein
MCAGVVDPRKVLRLAFLLACKPAEFRFELGGLVDDGHVGATCDQVWIFCNIISIASMRQRSKVH